MKLVFEGTYDEIKTEILAWVKDNTSHTHNPEAQALVQQSKEHSPQKLKLNGCPFCGTSLEDAGRPMRHVNFCEFNPNRKTYAHKGRPKPKRTEWEQSTIDGPANAETESGHYTDSGIFSDYDQMSDIKVSEGNILPIGNRGY